MITKPMPPIIQTAFYKWKIISHAINLLILSIKIHFSFYNIFRLQSTHSYDLYIIVKVNLKFVQNIVPRKQLFIFPRWVISTFIHHFQSQLACSSILLKVLPLCKSNFLNLTKISFCTKFHYPSICSHKRRFFGEFKKSQNLLIISFEYNQ
jgi:hypothetical protein